MKASERYAYARLARELSREPAGWLDADPPAWDWPPNRQKRHFWKAALFAIRYGSSHAPRPAIDRADAGKSLASLLRRMGG